MNPTQTAARHALESLIQKYRAMSADDRLQMSEASVVRQFIDLLLRDVLLWPIEDTQRYKYELVTEAGRPDITLIPPSGGTVFIEAKKFGVIKESPVLDKNKLERVMGPQQMALSGMVVDRTKEEQQAINYAFRNGGTWAILTNFEKFRLFHARRDSLVLNIESPDGYLEGFDYLWKLAYPNIITGGLEELARMRPLPEVDEEYLKVINNWRQLLAQDLVRREAHNVWIRQPDGSLNLADLRSVVQRYIDRMVLVRYAEAHLILTPGSLERLHEIGLTNDYVGLDVILGTMFRGFDEIHNSALFAPSLVDRASFSNKVLTDLIGDLYKARYRAMPPDIIGNTYEQYLGKTLVLANGSVKTAENLETRKKQGSYYTPQVIVQYIVDSTLGRYLYATTNGKPDGEPLPDETPKTSRDILHLRVLDSACGSGGFLIYAYQVLAEFYRREMDRLQQAADTRIEELIAQGITDPNSLRIETLQYLHERDRISDYRRIILEVHLYGVDLDPQAAEIAVVNLMMQAMVGLYLLQSDDKRLPLLLNQNIKVGNSLIGTATPPLTDVSSPSSPAGRGLGWGAILAHLHHLRQALLTTHHTAPEHERAIRDLQAATAAAKTDLNAALAPHFTDLEAVNPFHWAIEFPEVFVDEHGQPLDNPGFTIILGNPPWEILKPDLREFYAQFDENIESRYTREKAEKRIAELNAEDPNRLNSYEAQKHRIEESATYFRQSPDYIRQSGGDTATHKLFLERSYHLLNAKGRIGYVVPSGIYSDQGTKDLREMLFSEGRIESLVSLTNGLVGGEAYFPDIHRSFKITFLGAQKGVASDEFAAIFRIDPRGVPKPDELFSVLDNPENWMHVKRDLIMRFDPTDQTIMEFQSPIDYELAEKIYGEWPLLGQDIPNQWNLHFANEFHMANDSHLFNQQHVGFPLYEGKMIHQFESAYDVPRYWIDEATGIADLARSRAAHWYKQYRFAYREIARSTDERTCIAGVIPPNTFAGHTLWVGIAPSEKTLLYYVGIINSFCVDWIVRFKAGTHVTLFLMKSLPIPRLNEGHPTFDAIVRRAAQLTCTRPEFAALWESVMGETWDTSKGVTDSAARQQLRDEIDALVAQLYGLSAAEFEHILGTFPLVFPNTPEGEAKKAKLLATFAHFAGGS